MSTPGRGRRWLGLTLVVSGLVVLGWWAWQVFGTNWVSQRVQEEIVTDLEQAWDSGQDVATRDGDGSAQRASAIVRIPRFGSDYAVPVIQGVSDADLAAGFGHFTDTAGPGQVGNFALAGHRVTHGQPLNDMPQLEPGDEVVVVTRQWTYRYILDTGGADLEVPFTEGWVLEPEPVNPDGGVGPASGVDRLLTLVTCAELFHTDLRLVAFGHLASKEPTQP